MTIPNIEVTKNQNEPNISLIRRFNKRMRGSGVLGRARSLRFYARPKSKLKRKEQALKYIAKQKKRERLRKLGKI